MREIAVVLAVAACGSPTPAQPDAAPIDAPPLVLAEIPMNIVVIPGSVAVWMDAIDFGGYCAGNQFPAPGTCGAYTDAFPCSFLPASASCLTDLAVEIDGQRIELSDYGEDPRVFRDSRIASGPLTLVVAGCGHPETRIPFDGAPPLSVQATATRDPNTGVHVMWSTDASSSSAFVTLFSHLTPQFCHVADVTEHVFPSPGGAEKVSVAAFGSRSDVVTDIGPVTIWRGGTVTATIQ